MRTRKGFTLTEMMVAMALTLFIMVILSEAFVSGLQSFRTLRSIGAMQEGLRTATDILRKDLSADHFDGKKRLSDPNFWGVLPRQGFFRLYQPAISVNEGTDPDTIVSNRGNHRLHFAVRLRGNGREDFFSAPLPAGSPLLNARTNFFDQAADARFQDTPLTLNSQWGEVGYFLVQTGTTTEPNNPNALPSLQVPAIFALYRSQFVVVADNSKVVYPAPVVPVSAITNYANVSCQPGGGVASAQTLTFNTPEDLTNPTTRALDPTTTPPQRQGFNKGSLAGASIVLSNVISFDVQVLKGGTNTFVDLAGAGTVGNFDTNATNTFTINALRISVRVWDQKTQLTRQVTIIQDM